MKVEDLCPSTAGQTRTQLTVARMCFAQLLHARPFVCPGAVRSVKKNEDYGLIADVDAHLLVVGDPTSEKEPMRGASCLQAPGKLGRSG